MTGHADVAGYGDPPKADFWINRGCPNKPPLHVAFRVNPALSSMPSITLRWPPGGHSNGGPGLRPHYHPDYYGAFVLDPDGHNIEVVCHEPG